MLDRRRVVLLFATGSLLTGGGCGSDAVGDPTPCGSGLLFCDGACVDPVARDDHCGACGNACGMTQGCFAGGCTSPSPLLTPRAGHAAVRGSNGWIYAIGGADSSVPMADVDAYDPATNRWIRKASLNTPRGYLTAVVVDDDIYAIGGSETGLAPFSFSTKVEVYDVNSDSWSYAAPLQLGRADTSAALGDGKIWVFGGITDGGLTDKVEVFDPDEAAPEWKDAEPMPAPRNMHRAVSHPDDGTIYLCGGGDAAGAPTHQVLVFDPFAPAKDAWAIQAPDMLLGRSIGGAAVSADGRIYYAGGLDSAFVQGDEAEVYEGSPAAWRALPPMPDDRFDTAAATTLDGRFYVVAGEISYIGTASDTLLIYDPVRDGWIR